jgi:23S rRNA pseudouridine1911/1915/1917 synthase
MRQSARRDAPIGEILSEMLPGSSGRTRKQLLTHRRVRIGDRVATKASDPVKKGDDVEIGPAKKPIELPSGLKLRHEDDEVIVVRKGDGLLTIATPTEKEKTAYAYLSAHVKTARPGAKIFVVHRLDKLASGLLVFAKSPEAKHALQAQFEAHTVERAYAAVIEGTLVGTAGTLVSQIEEGGVGRVHETKSPTRGREAITHWRLLEEGPKFTLLELKLETGRKNQIRVQLSGAGHAIVGDEMYGSRIDPIRRLALHARTLGFLHPATGRRLQFDEPVPGEFYRLVRGEIDADRKSRRSRP